MSRICEQAYGCDSVNHYLEKGLFYNNRSNHALQKTALKVLASVHTLC